LITRNIILFYFSLGFLESSWKPTSIWKACYRSMKSLEEYFNLDNNFYIFYRMVMLFPINT
jgi:hypothetical protein